MCSRTYEAGCIDKCPPPPQFHGQIRQPRHVCASSYSSFSTRRRSNLALYFSYDSRKFRSTRDEKMSSPRGLFAGGMGAIGTLAPLFRRRSGLVVRVGDGVANEGSGVPLRNNDKGFKVIRDRRGLCRTFRYMLKFRSALLA